MKSKQGEELQAVDLGLPEVSTFQIKSSGKAFLALINGIYSDKVLAPVRELMTNAHDAHISAGNTDEPFDVHVPTVNVPEFRVRDYGVGMPHTQVMTSYSTLFDSTKDGSDDEVGMLGLGSKSPFAYCSAFTLTCFDGVTKRTYSAHLNGGIPQIALMGEIDHTGPVGTEVKFVTESGDRLKFANAVARCLVGFVTVPNLAGGPVVERGVRATYPLSTIYERFTGWGNHDSLSDINVRMGCVVYPLVGEGRGVMDSLLLPDDYAVVVNVPIGTTDITTNREGLSLDRSSVQNVRKCMNLAFADMQDAVTRDYVLADTDLSRAQAGVKVPRHLRTPFNIPKDPHVYLYKKGDKVTQDDVDPRLELGNYVMGWRYRDKNWHPRCEFSYEALSSMEFIRDDPKAVRRTSRIKSWVGHGDTRFIVPDDGGETERKLLTEVGVSAHQIKTFSTIHDPGPPIRNASGSPRQKQADIEKRLQHTPWMGRMRNKVSTTGILGGGVMHNTIIPSGLFLDQVLGGDNATSSSSRIQFLTDAQVAKLKPDPEMALGRVMRRHWDAGEYASRIRSANTARAVSSDLSAVIVSSAVRELMAAEGYTLEISKLDSSARRAVYGSGDSLETDADPVEVDATVAWLRSKYRSLVRMETHEVTAYIKEMNQQ